MGAALKITDRGYRYRANQAIPEHPKVCVFCGSSREKMDAVRGRVRSLGLMGILPIPAAYGRHFKKPKYKSVPLADELAATVYIFMMPSGYASSACLSTAQLGQILGLGQFIDQEPFAGKCCLHLFYPHFQSGQFSLDRVDKQAFRATSEYEIDAGFEFVDVVFHIHSIDISGTLSNHVFHLFSSAVGNGLIQYYSAHSRRESGDSLITVLSTLEAKNAA